MNPVEAMIAPLAACAVLFLQHLARTMDVPIEDVTAEAEADFDPRGVRGEAVDSALAAVRLTYRVRPGSGADRAGVEKLVEAFRARCPVHRTFAKAVDIAADFRLHAPEAYKEAYGSEHPAPHLLPEAVYGLPELHREAIKTASLVANPGCYPEAALLALAPAVREGLVTDDVIVDAKSGISGAGRAGLATGTMDHFAEANENVVVYALEGHGHRSEITQEVAELREADDARVTFVPHRIPMTRGILATCYAPLTGDGMTKEAVREVYRDFYHDEPFVMVTDTPPQTKQTVGSNFCLVHPTVDRRTNRLIVVSCIDNLVKGAAGQAVQNMNLMFGLREEKGLERPALYP